LWKQEIRFQKRSPKLSIDLHVGEYIASKIFDIKLESSAAAKGIDGRFNTGILEGKTVNIKLYGKKENLLDISIANLADYYLVLCGDDGDLLSSKGKTRPLVISQVFLFNMNSLMLKLKKRGVQIGIATSVRKADWEEAMIYPRLNNEVFRLDDNKIRLIKLFDGSKFSEISGYGFLKLCDIQAAMDENGDIYEY